MIELIKCKTNTKPEAHSGEGIFFVSRAVNTSVPVDAMFRHARNVQVQDAGLSPKCPAETQVEVPSSSQRMPLKTASGTPLGLFEKAD